VCYCGFKETAHVAVALEQKVGYRKQAKMLQPIRAFRRRWSFITFDWAARLSDFYTAID